MRYVEALIGPDTVNTMPRETFDAYRDDGRPAVRLEDDLEHACGVMRQLPEVGIDLDRVTQQLEDEGVEKFNQPFDRLLEAVRNAQHSE